MVILYNNACIYASVFAKFLFPPERLCNVQKTLGRDGLPVFDKMHDILNVLARQDGRGNDGARRQPLRKAERIKIGEQRAVVLCGKNAALSEPMPSAFKLRLEEHERPSALPQKAGDGGQDEL